MPIYANQDFNNARLKTFKEEEETGVLNEFGKGFGAGVDQLQALAGGAKALVGSAVGNDDWFYDGMQYFDEQMAEAAENTADVGRLEDIDGGGDLANYAAFIVGNIIPSLIGGGGVGAVGGFAAKKLAIHQGAKALVKKNAEGMAKSAASRQYAQSAVGREALGKVGLKGQVAGAVGFGTVMGAGESFTRIFDETGEEAAGLALVTGLASGALDAMTPMRVLKRVLPQNLYGKATQEIAENVSKKQSVIGRAFKEAAKASGTEGVTEMMQEVVQNSTLEFVRGQQDPAIEEAFLERLFDEENRSQYLNAFVAGAIGGGAIGGVTGAVTKDPELKQNLDENALDGKSEESSPEVVLDEEQAQEQEQAPVIDDQPQPESTDKGGAKVQAAREKALDLPKGRARNDPRTDPLTVEQAREQARSRTETQIDGRRLPTGRTTIAPKSREEVRREIDDFPDRQDRSDPEARQEEARAKARAQIEGLPAVREKVKKIYQMELGALGETTRIPKDKEPEPVAEEPPVFGGNLPESITPRMEELVGQDVDYNGNKGPVLKKDDGFYVATQDNGDVLIESGEYQSPEQLGVVPTGGNLVFEKDVQIDDNNKFELRGKKYSLTRIIRDAEGNPLSLAVRDENGAKKTIRTPEVVARINNQKTPVPDFSQIIVELDDLPASIQKQVIQQSDPDNIPDSVPASQAIDIAQSMPNAEAVVEGIQEIATQSLTIPQGSMSDMPAVAYTENVTRPNMKPLAQAISDINDSQGANRSPIDQGRIDSLFASPEVVMQNGNTITVAEGVQADEIKHALVDLLGAGLPKRVMNYVSGFYSHTDSQMDRQVAGSYLKASKAITLNSARVKELIADKDNSSDSAIELRFNLAHEIGHAFDVGTGHTTNSPDFSLEVNGMGMNSATYEMGPVIHELGQNYLSGTELGQELAYPFGPAFEWIANSEPQNIAGQVDRMQKEAFAQAFAIFHTSPELLQEQAPKTYKHLERLLRTQPTETIQNGEADIRTNEANGQPQEVQGEVRSPTQRGSTQVQEQEGSGGDGGSSLDAEQASQGLGEPTQREAGDRDGRAVQLEQTEPKVKRAADFENTGNYNVTYPDGTEYLIYRDTMQFANPMWHLSPEYYDILKLDFNAIARTGGIGDNRKEALQWLNKAHSERLEKAEADAVQQDLGDIDDDYDPMDDLAGFDDDALYQAVSTRFPTAKERTQDPLRELLVNDYESFLNAGNLFSKNIALIKPYTNLTQQEQNGSDEVVAERFVNHVRDNLLYIFDSVPQATREVSKQWYEGANKIVQRMADRHGISLAQASAVTANLSPQKDWYQNASLAERVIDIYHQNMNDPFDQAMKEKAEQIYFHKGVNAKTKIENREKLDIIKEKSLSDLIREDAPSNILGMWIRTYDQTYNAPSYRIVSPDGKLLDYALNANGKTRSKVAWGSLSEIGKAVTALINSDMDTLSLSLGDKNKVRNFYNNIFDPASDLGFVTIDTHAVAAGLIRPLGGNSPEVAANFGSGASNSTVTGHRGTYSLYEEAYRRAAKDRNVLPREMQSITWEAVRGLFTAGYKSNKQNGVFVQGVWSQYNNGKLSLDEARVKINEHSGGIQRPDWERSDSSVPDEVSETSYERILSDRGVPRQDSGPQEATGSGARIDAAGVSTDQLDSPPQRPSEKDFVTAPTSTAAEIMSDEDLVASVRAGSDGSQVIDAVKDKDVKAAAGFAASGFKKWFQKNFYSRGLLPETAFDSKIERDGEFGAVEMDIRQMVGLFDEAVQNNFGEIDASQAAVLDKAMQVPAAEVMASKLPNDIKEALVAMRNYIDKMSADYAEILNSDIEKLKSEGNDEALAKSELLSIVVNNMGKYANRSHRAFDDKNWNKEVPKEIILAARNFLVEQGTTNPDQVINTILKEGTAFDDMSSFIAESKLGAKDLSILKKQKDIAPEIRALLGEYKDARINFAKSATKMSRLIYNDRFLNQVLKDGKGVFLFDQADAPVGATKKIAEVGSKTMSPLNGLYTFPEIEQAFRDALDKEQLGGLYKTVIQINGMVKYGKTVIAPTTMARNWMSASLFTVANGHFNWSKIGKSIDVTSSYRTGQGDGVEYLKRLKKLGVVHDNPYAGEMVDLLKDTNAEQWVSGTGMMKSFFDNATRFYQYGDDFWKIVGFENEIINFMENKGMSREEAEIKSAKRIRDTYPTYSLIGDLPQKLRRFPLAGTFVSFPAEIVRTQANMIKYLREDLADPDMRPAALKRIAGIGMVSAGVYAAQAMAMSAFGVSEEEEEAIKLMAAPWAKNSNILVTGRDDQGRLEYLDLTHLDPYALMKRPLNALLRDQPLDDAVVDAGVEILKPFLGWDISTNTILEFISNEKTSGGEVYNEADTLANKAVDTYMHFERGMGPSVIQNGRRMEKALSGEISRGGKAYDVGDEMAAFIGFRKTTFDPKTALHFKAYEFSEGKRQSTRLLTSVFRDPNDVSDSDIREAFGRASTARRETFEDMAALVSAAMSSGLNATQTMTILRSNGVTKKDARALIQGGASAWTMSDSTLKNSISKSDVLFGKQKSKEFVDRWTLIQQLLNEELN